MAGLSSRCAPRVEYHHLGQKGRSSFSCLSQGVQNRKSDTSTKGSQDASEPNHLHHSSATDHTAPDCASGSGDTVITSPSNDLRKSQLAGLGQSENGTDITLSPGDGSRRLPRSKPIRQANRRLPPAINSADRVEKGLHGVRTPPSGGGIRAPRFCYPLTSLQNPEIRGAGMDLGHSAATC